MTAQSTVNVPLLRQLVEWVEAETAKPTTQREWRQGYWMLRQGERHNWCGTQVCVAGKAALLAGWEPVFETEFDDETTKVRNVETGEEDSVADVAARVLGLDDPFGLHPLFEASNSAADVRQIAENEAGQPL